MKRNTKLVQPIKLPGSFRLIDFIVIILFLSIAAISINMFRIDLLQTINLRNVEPVGYVVIRKNIVQRRLTDRILWDRLAAQSPVYMGDLIRVAELSSASLFIEGNSIELNENTLIRIMREPDGKSLQIIMNTGTISISSSEESAGISLEINGRQIHADSNVVFNVTAVDEEIILQVYEGSIQLIEDGQTQEVTAEYIAAEERRLIVLSGAITRLQSPAASSIFKYTDELPVLRFQWEEIEDVNSYTLEVCSTPDFSAPVIQRQSQINFFTASGLEEGTWYWRVKALFPQNYLEEYTVSQTNYFNIEKITEEPQSLNLSQWFIAEIPPEIIAVSESITAEQVVLQEAPILLPAPRILQPVRGRRFTMNDLQNQRSINFSWQPVTGANAYILTIYQQTNFGRRQIFRTQPLRSPNYSLEDLRILDNGTFIWQVESVNRGQNNVIEQRGNMAESTFIMDIILPGMIQVEGTGVIYEN